MKTVLLALFLGLVLAACGKEGAVAGLVGTYQASGHALSFDNDTSGHYRLTTASGNEEGIFYVYAGAITFERPTSEVERCILNVQATQVTFTSCNPTVQRSDDALANDATWTRTN